MAAGAGPKSGVAWRSGVRAPPMPDGTCIGVLNPRLFQRQRQTAEVGTDDEAGPAAGQREHCAALIGQHDRLRATHDGGAGACLAIDAATSEGRRIWLTVPWIRVSDAPKVNP